MERLVIPVDLECASFKEQLAFIARWANLPEDVFFAHEAAITHVFLEGLGQKSLRPVIHAACPKTLWYWQAYDDFVAERWARMCAEVDPEYAEDETPEIDDVRFFETDALLDRAAHIADKLTTRHYHLHRWTQISKLKDFRPFWEASSGERGTFDLKHYAKPLLLPATDAHWDTKDAPWNCERFACCCSVSAYSRTEVKSRIEEDLNGI